VLLLRVRALSGGLNVEARSDLRHQPRDVRSALSELIPQGAGIAVEDVCAQRFHQRQIRHEQRPQWALLDALANQHTTTAVRPVVSGVLAQRRFADARLAKDGEYAAMPGRRAIERRTQQLQLLMASYERTSRHCRFVGLCHELGRAPRRLAMIRLVLNTCFPGSRLTIPGSQIPAACFANTWSPWRVQRRAERTLVDISSDGGSSMLEELTRLQQRERERQAAGEVL
jgi:hypothetical protein